MTSLAAYEQMDGFATRQSPQTGGARKRGLGGCFTTAIAASILATRARALPSGQRVELQEVLMEGTGDQSVARFRFIAPEIARNGGTVRFDQAEQDMAHLCETVALPYLAQQAMAAQKVVISLSDRAVDFGSADPDATQYFEAYRIEEKTCIWEIF